MSQRVIRISQLASTKNRKGLLPVSPATIWRWCRAGTFPAPFKLAAHTTVWDAGAVEEFITKQRSSKS